MFICLYNYSATTEIYTYCPTHSLHDALPIFDHILHLEGGKVTLYPGGYDAFERQRAERAAQLAAARAAQDAQRRSEEHTSELQSLMRISYAVFCLKKKNTLFHGIISARQILRHYHSPTYNRHTTGLLT